MAETAIEWTERSWNPIVGCSLVSPGCTNCYAMGITDRFKDVYRGRKWAGMPAEAMTRRVNGKAVWTGQLTLAPDHALTEPLRRKKPTTYFVNSMGDLFHEDVPDEWIDRVFAVMALAPQHTFQVLTKRAARMRVYMAERTELLSSPDDEGGGPIARAVISVANDEKRSIQIALSHINPTTGRWPLRNVWLGVSAEDQTRADARIPDLLATPAAIRFVSAEPLLGPIDFESITYPDGLRLDALSGLHFDCEGAVDGIYDNPDPKLDWIIVGGESGPSARPMHPAWARSIRDQCAAAGTAFFFKQWGEWSPHTAALEDAEGSIRTTPRGGVNWQAEKPGGAFGVFRVGKKAAGRLLDGVEHNAMPERRL